MTNHTEQRSTGVTRANPAAGDILAARGPAMAEPATTPPARTSARPRRFGDRLHLTARPDTFGQRVLNSAAVWLALMAFWALADLLIAIFPPGGRPMRPEGGPTLAVYALLGLAAIAAMHRTGFPAAWDARIQASRRLLLPTLVGAGFGLLTVGTELVTGTARMLEAKMGAAINVAFPGSLLTSSAAAIKFEFLFLLLPVPVLLWLISNVVLRGRGQAPTFWVLAALSSAVEPVLQGTMLLTLAQGAIGPGVFAVHVAETFATNFAAAVLFRRYGLLAAILVRLGHYLVWHVAYGNFFA